MCGIAGFVPTPGASIAPAIDATRRMTDHMRRRGPDAEGLWSSAGVVLGHRRLAILDLDARANQPMVSADGRYAIIFNGEIYNFRELRRELEADGVAFRTTSDTEVLLMLFAREGERMLPRLRGMFAFAIWDTQSRELFLARDPYGIKPLYYTQTKHGLVFVSQVKALLASGFVATEREPAGLAGFYLWGNVPELWTLYRDVFALPARHWLRVRAGVADAPVGWHDIRPHWQGEGCETSAHELRERVGQAVTDSVRAHLVADVPEPVITVRHQRPSYYPEIYRGDSWSWPRQRFLYEIHASNRLNYLNLNTLGGRLQWWGFRLKLSFETTKWLVYAVVRRKWRIIQTCADSATPHDQFWLRGVRYLLFIATRPYITKNSKPD